MSELQSAEDMADVTVDEVVDSNLEPLFEDETVSDDELMGKDPEEDEKPKGESAASPEPKGDESKEPEKEPDEKSGEEQDEEPGEGEKSEKDEDAPDYTSPPPKGYVPLPALQNERKAAEELRKALNSAEESKNELLAEIEALKHTPESDPEWFTNFKVLSVDEFEEMVDEDPDEASKYQYRLNEYNKIREAKNQTVLAERQRRDREQQIIERSVKAIQDAVPGLYGEGNEKIMDAFVKTAVDAGFDEQYLNVMSRPDTLIIPPGGKVPVPLGAGAVSLTKLIDALYKASNVRSKIEAELRPELEKEITAKLMEKLKIKSTDEFKSITSVPGSGGEPGGVAELSEADLAKLSDADQERYLAGAL